MEDPGAASSEGTPLPCTECPEQFLQQYLDSPAGKLIGVVIDLDAALQAGMTISLNQVTYPEFVVLRQLLEERDRFSTEEAKRKQQR